jgi:hypothetical protein
LSLSDKNEVEEQDSLGMLWSQCTISFKLIWEIMWSV